MSASTAGDLTETPPVGISEFSNPIAYVLDANTLLVFPWRPNQALNRSNDRRTISTSTTPYNVTDVDELILVDASGGAFTVMVQTMMSL